MHVLKEGAHSMAKEIAYDNETREKLATGVAKLADAVRVTIGPKGRYVGITKKGERHPNVSNDGATVAAHVGAYDHVEKMGLQVVREAATAANNEAGDGTSTATLLADAIVREGVRYVTAGNDPLALRRGIQKAADVASDELLKAATQVTTREQMAEIATVSSGDPEIGAKIAEALDEIGQDGVISVEKSTKFGIDLEVKKGMLFDRGFISPYMADDMGSMTGELEQPYILITDQRLADNFKDVVPVLEEVMQSGHPLLIVADDVRGESLNSLLMNRQKGTLISAAVMCPGAEERRKAELEDMAILTGGEVISPERGLSLADAKKSMLGRAASVQITKSRTLIIGGKGKQEAIEKRCEAIRNELKNPHSDYELDVMRERLAKLSGGVAVLKVGAATEVEMKEKKLRIEDALNATRAAVEEGIVAGGGTAYVNAIASVEKLLAETEGDEKTGVSIIAKALTEPMRQIATNAGIDGSVVLENVKKADKVGYGFDAYNETYVDMISAGIVDPTKVTRSALENAASIAATLLTTESLVADKPQPPAPAAPAAPDMGGMY